MKHSQLTAQLYTVSDVPPLNSSHRGSISDREIAIICGEAGAKMLRSRAPGNQLGEHFGIRTLLLEGGDHINGAFLQADRVDEVSLLLVPGIDGSHDIPAVFEGVNPARNAAVPLKLKSVEQRANDTLWIRYSVVGPKWHRSSRSKQLHTERSKK
jgi:riboflavin biosynthesis pyrimidine reductase